MVGHRERRSMSSEREITHLIVPFFRFGGLGDQLQIHHVTPEGCSKLMTEEQACEGAPLTLPGLGQPSEANVLREQDASQFAGTLQEPIVWEQGAAILDCRHHVHAAAAQLIRDRVGDVHIKVKAYGHLNS